MTGKALNPYPQCVDCLVSLARNAAELAHKEDKELRLRAEELARKILKESREAGLNSPEIANRILRDIRRISGVSDPYAGFKKNEITSAAEAFSKVEDLIGTNLRSKAAAAVLGNSLDFFMQPRDAFSGIRANMTGLYFYMDNIPRLEELLSKKPGTVLYLTDNSGEIYFDLPFYRHIEDRSERTVLVVKGGPSLNDLTAKDLESTGIRDEFGEVQDTGTDGAGIDWNLVSDGFINLLGRADLIVAKGMANFETVYPRELRAHCFFLFRVKCKPVQDWVRVPKNHFVALWRNGAKA